MEAVRIARRNGFDAIISHRSGETEDAFIADLSVALNTGLIKQVRPPVENAPQNTIVC